jgi:hypothetical protein
MGETLVLPPKASVANPRADAAPQPSAAPPEAEPAVCPRCGDRLIDPDGLGWCQACGYCGSLEEERAKETPPKPKARARPSPLGVVEFFCLLVTLPRWMWTLLGGIVAVVLLSLLPGQLFPDDPLGRCLWCTCQQALGVTFILAAQWWAVMVLADSDDQLSGRDAVFSGRLWPLALRQFEKTHRQFSLAVWGLTMVLGAFVFVGGLTHWLTYLPRSTNAPPPSAVSHP